MFGVTQVLACYTFDTIVNVRFDQSQVILTETYFRIHRCTAVLQVADLNNQQLATLLLAI